ncbi:MAG: alpha/beta hydrolase [Lachnospiraceae bacterium]
MQYYRIEGRKPVKFVVEMGLGACVEEWNSLAQNLKNRGGVLLYERAGTGRSKSSGAERSPENIAAELHELLNHIEHEPKIILLAHSQGGLYAQQYIRMYPEQVQGVIFIDPLSAGDYVFKEQLTEKEYVKSGVDKSKNLLILEKMAKFRLGWISRKMMKNAPPFYYAEFSEQETEAILNSYTDRGHLRTCYQEYLLAHEKERVKDLREKGDFPDIPLTLITHSSAFAIEESMKFGNNTYEFAAKIEEMWQNLMKEYLRFSSESRYVQADHSGHYIHLTEPELILREVDRMLQND